MGSFGERLQREREMRSITLQEISNSTKISTRMLKALEDEDFSRLPGGIFNKGFVRAYCRYLGIDEEQAVADYLAALAENEKKTPDAVRSNNVEQLPVVTAPVPQHDSLNRIQLDRPEEPADISRYLVPAAVCVIMVLGTIGLGKYWVDHRGDVVSAKNSAPEVAPSTASTQPEQPSSDSVSAQPAAQAADSNSQQPKSTANQAATVQGNKPDSSSISSVKPAINDKKEDQGALSPGAVAPVKTAAPITSADTILTAADNSDRGIVHLQIHAREDSWVRITGDGRLLMEGVIKASMDKSFRTGKEMVVTLGNAGGVDMTYNGKSIPSFPPDTKYKQMTFANNGSMNQ